jgi:MoxR-like ATPase
MTDMETLLQFPYYKGKAERIQSKEGEETWRSLPTPDLEILKSPEHYLAPPDLAAAVNVSLELGMPLLLTGDPGCGKSRLADSIAWELGFKDGKALRYVVSSDMVKRDLFYEFDALGRFRATNDTSAKQHEARHFIKYNALGLAILRANGKKTEYEKIMRDQDWSELPEQGVRSVVLIDEIDKAPREVPNDLLTQLEDLSFNVPELLHNDDIKLDKDQQNKRPIIIITSNGERDLPPAFLRRCIYFHIDLPPFRDENKTAEITIESIVEERLGSRFKGHDRVLKDAYELFRRLRGSTLEQKPSVAELLAWLLYLGKRLPSGKSSLREHEELRQSLKILVKPHHKGDRDRANKIVEEWLESAK